jgi:hypothetical protein
MAAMPSGARPAAAGPGNSGRLTGLAVFAGVAPVVSGTLSVPLGISAIARDTLYRATPQYVYRFDLTAWGWIHLVVGVVLVATGFGVLTSQSWGRWAGVALGAVSLVTQFMFIPYYPLWSISVMTLDLLIIWGLSRFHV